MSAASAACDAIIALKSRVGEVRSLQEWHALARSLGGRVERNARDPGFVAELARGIRGGGEGSGVAGRFSTYRIGGPGTVLLPASAEDVAAGLRLAASAGVPVFAPGSAPTSSCPDRGSMRWSFASARVSIRMRSDGERWWLGSGPTPRRSRPEDGGTGGGRVHMMVGVPGSVGGGIYMNAGCHGGQRSDVTVSVAVWIAPVSCARSPRQRSLFLPEERSRGFIVIEAEVRLSPGSREELDSEVEKLFTWRQKGTPFNQPCCGSVFKNPGTGPGVLEPAVDRRKPDRVRRTEGNPSRWSRNLADACELFRQHRRCDRRRRARADRLARAAVIREFGVTLETEVKVIGSAGEYVASDQ